MKPTICTFSGIEFAPFAPTVGMILADDIAHALANMPRFSGHTSRFYSVAQHCLSVSYTCAPEDAAYGLLHDASEAYLLDVPSPLKDWFVGYRQAEADLQAVILRAFGLEPIEPASVKAADAMALQCEQRDLMPDVDWWQKPQMQQRLCYGSSRPMLPGEAKGLYIGRLIQLHRAGLVPRLPTALGTFALEPRK